MTKHFFRLPVRFYFFFTILILKYWIVSSSATIVVRKELTTLEHVFFAVCIICFFFLPSNYFIATVILIYTRLTLANDKLVPVEEKSKQTTKVASVVIDWNKSHFVFSQMTRGRVILGISLLFFSISPLF